MSADDPLGRRALFGPPAGEAAAPGTPMGRRAFFSQPPPEGPPPDASTPAPARPVAVLECGRCATRTPLDLRGVAHALVPSLWVPLRPLAARRRHDRLTRCPACGRWAWCRLRRP